MKIQIKLDYLDKIYLSKEQECEQNDVDQAKDLIKKIAEGKITYLSIENKTEEYFFTKQILEKSIITVIVTQLLTVGNMKRADLKHRIIN